MGDGLGGVDGHDGDNRLDATLIGAIVGATVAVGSAIAVMCTPSETLKGILHSGQTQTKTETCDKEQITFKDSISCLSISKRMAQCLETNDYDIKNCRAYFDLLKECEKSQ